MIWKSCEYCGLPAAHDVFGNTDHVCWDGPAADLLRAILPTPKQNAVVHVVIESTAAGLGNNFYDMWSRRGW